MALEEEPLQDGEQKWLETKLSFKTVHALGGMLTGAEGGEVGGGG